MLSFTGNPLNRASAQRADDAWIAAQRQAGRFLPFWQMKPLAAEVTSGAGRRRAKAGFLPWQAEWEGRTTIFLGLDGAQALFAVDLGKDEPAPQLAGEFHDMRAAAFILSKRDTAIAGQAKALLDWHARHGFCPNCGQATETKDGGYRRLCPACGAEHFPRTDPVVIMLPIFGDECLVGRNVRFVNGLFSAFAGFVEPGETLEEAVKRELKEEAALAVARVRYSRSQPWPFPSSLMLGCYAEALSKDFTIDGSEIAEARWVRKDQARRWLKEEVLDEMRVPAVIAIAHHLIRDWVEG
ncbi:MAG: NAD(+) diphosphatase [Alphaproteobacteria bacterium]|nr:NAD(+) diphosphatase [Alphaproteobacteria bacterium]